MSCKPNYELKSRLIGSDLLGAYINVQRAYYWHDKINNALADGEVIQKPMSIWSYSIACKTDLEYQKTCFIEWQECGRLYNNFRLKRKRLNDRISFMLQSGICLFLTLTFNDETLSNTSEETRRRYVARFLKKYSDEYVANIDYGEKNEREHYHAVIMCDKVNHSDWQCGAINFKKVRTTNDNKALANYIAKLTNHAIKKTTKRNHIIYSR